MASGFGQEKDCMNVFCLVLWICNFSRMFVYLSKFSYLFPIHLVFLSLALQFSFFNLLYSYCLIVCGLVDPT